MKTIKEHKARLVKEYKEELDELNLFELRMKMLEELICPKCGIRSCLGGSDYHFECFNSENDCNFRLSDKEFGLIYDGRKGILNRKIKMSKIRKHTTMIK